MSVPAFLHLNPLVYVSPHLPTYPQSTVYLPVDWPASLSTYLPSCLPAYLYTDTLQIYLANYFLCTFVSIHLPTYLSICLPTLWTCIPLCPTACPPPSLPGTYLATCPWPTKIHTSLFVLISKPIEMHKNHPKVVFLLTNEGNVEFFDFYYCYRSFRSCTFCRLWS
jgi:hypothetical protein